MGVSFGIDFSGSTNFVLLPTAAAPASASQTSPTEGQHSRKPRSTAASDTESDDGAEKEGGQGTSGGNGTPDKLRDEEVAPKRTPTVGEVLSKECNVSARREMSARVSTGAFCRALVARVAVRDPKVTGIIKVGSPSRHLTGRCTLIHCMRLSSTTP